MFIRGIGLLLLVSGSVLAKPAATSPAWQSLKIEQTVSPTYPANLLFRGVTEGQADIAIATTADGRLEDLLALAYTRPEFAASATAAIKRWTYIPARLRGERVGTVVVLRFFFKAEGVVVSSVSINDTVEMQLRHLLGRHYEHRICSAGDLDRPPVPIAAVAPRYPRQLLDHGVKGTVTVEFFIDETGTVRLPAVVSRHDNPLLCNLAVDALNRWKFAPPTVRGRAVLVRASQQFVFGNGS